MSLPGAFRPAAAVLSRRAFVIGATGFVLSACGGEKSVDSMASASRGSDRTSFVDTVAWVEPSRRTAVLAFIPYRLDDDQRNAVIAGQSVYPALDRYDPMLELRFEMKPNAATISPDDIKAMQLTFWHFDNPAPVVREEADTWADNDAMSLVGVDGQFRHGGWAVGTVRGQKVVSSAVGSQAFTWNLGYQISLV